MPSIANPARASSFSRRLLRLFGRSAAFLPSLGLLAALSGLVLFSTRVSDPLWSHLWAHVLGPAFLNSVLVTIATLVVTALVGVSFAWLVVFVEFPGRNFLSAALALPLAFPAYVLAFLAIGAFDFSGALPVFLRENFAIEWTHFFNIRSRTGMILVLSVSFYPYVFLLAREAFRSQGRLLFEAARSLGCSRQAAVWRLSLPLAKPWILAGLSLVFMESFADFGVASAFNIETLTTAVYRVWFGLFSLPHAAQIALVHLAIVCLFLFFLSRVSKDRGRYDTREGGIEAPEVFVWKAPYSWTLSALLFAFWGISFCLPLLQLMVWAFQTLDSSYDSRLWRWLFNSLFTSVSTATLVCFFSILISYLERLSKRPLSFQFARIANLGYSIPGSVLALAFSVMFILFLGSLAGRWELAIVAMLFALSIRFLNVGFQPIFQSLKRISPQMDEAAQSLGSGSLPIFRRLHLPLLKSSLGGALLFVFMDCLKEMPIHVMMRPFGWETLAVRVFDFTREGEWERAALPALLLLSLSFPAVLWLALKTKGKTAQEWTR